MERKPLVSFIIPTYNLPNKMLRDCIESILALSLKDNEREVIVVDDGSDCSPLPSLSDISDKIKFVRQENGGLSLARNRGLQEATGEYIQFVDGDDLLVTNLYEHCLDIVRSQKPDMVMFDFCRKQSPKNTCVDLPVISGKDLMLHHNIKATAWAYVFKAEALGNLRFTPGILHEDEEFTPQLLLHMEKVVRTTAQAYFYRIREDSITTARNFRKMLKRFYDLKSVIYKLHARSSELNGQSESLALLRRVHQLVMDYIYIVIVETRSRKFLARQLKELRSHGLFPLPDKNYTSKYRLFRLLTSTKAGLSFLFIILPFIKREG